MTSGSRERSAPSTGTKMIPPRTLAGLPSPCYLIDLAALRRNLELLSRLRQELDLKILLALKSFACWRLAPIILRHLDGVNAASIHEARLGLAEFGGEVHLTAPAYSRADMDELFRRLAARPEPPPFYLVFNSLSQWRRYGRECRDRGLFCGLRVNPERPLGRMPIYDPSRPGSRLGVIRAELDAIAPSELEGLTGLHFHVLCEQGADALALALEAFEEKFGHLLCRMEWVNFGGGHHLTRLRGLHPELTIEEDYDLELLGRLVRDFRARHPLRIYLEPGEAVTLNAGFLVATVLDIVERDLPTVILDASAEAHMPDVIEAPYTPPVAGASPWTDEGPAPANTYRLAGNTCLAGDVIGTYVFEAPLAIGSKVVFQDQAYYTMVKNNTFNGIALPAIALLYEDGFAEVIRQFGYEDYRTRLS